MGRSFENLKGREFGRLTVIDRADGFPHSWFCKCNCGGDKIARAGNLKSGNTQSCGCLVSEVKGSRRPSVTKPGAAFRSLFYRYKKDAARRNYSFTLTEDEFRILTSGLCIYCGASPSSQIKAWSGEVYVYNGVDRRHNEHGYHIGNCVSCCERCNRFKGRLDPDQFVAFCGSISNHCTLGGAA